MAVNFVQPLYTKSRIASAGKRISKGRGTDEDTLVLENFRAAHAWVINTFQMNARRHAAKVPHTVGQRLKRRNTIIDKLLREPAMPLHAMHDIAGIRLIFDSQKDLYRIRDGLREARFNHARLNELDKYDYIKSPKPTGYRGVHDAYAYNVDREPGSGWNGLKIEVQFRTRVQHAWATAVEVADLITSNRIKFNDAQAEHIDYFRLASEILARAHEGQNSCLGHLKNRDLLAQFENLENEIGLLRTFANLRQAEPRRRSVRRNTLLIFRFDSQDVAGKLEIRTFENINKAIEEYDRLEKELGELADIVLVKGESEEGIRDVFRNYFSDARDFVDLVRKGLAQLA